MLKVFRTRFLDACSYLSLKIRCQVMKLFRVVLAAGFLALIVAVAWLALNRPRDSDMANYAPADSLVYVESNSLLEIADSIAGTDAWRALRPFIQPELAQTPNAWMARFLAWTGIGPTSKVILCRAQFAIVMLDLGASEEGDTLTIRPEAAFIVETHTSAWRIRETVEQALAEFAEKSYEHPTFQRTNVDQTEYLVWTAPSSNRQIVATIDRSVVIVGNSQRAARACLEVRRGHSASLSQNPELRQMRTSLTAPGSLAFGFVSSSHAAQLLAIGTPLLIGRSPGDLKFERAIATGAAKVLGGIGWSCQRNRGGIEDRYLFSLQPSVVSRLRPVFRGIATESQGLDLLPDDAHSITIYNFEDPAATWRTLSSAVSAQLDTLSAVVFTSLAKSALVPYGIEQPEQFLQAVGPELITARLKPDAERALLIARVRNEAVLKEILLNGAQVRQERIGEDELKVFSDKRAIVFYAGYLLMGLEEDVRSCLQAKNGASTTGKLKSDKLSQLTSLSSSTPLVTYTNEARRLQNLLFSIRRASTGNNMSSAGTDVDRALSSLPYSATETMLGEQGIERRTRSSLGQFSTLITLLLPATQVSDR